ncbi:MAG TPA: M48 family metalloprotease [Thermoanaerobaculia bacterium]|jgi:predicted Zn-dependent protease|nr:M48 family metalloprotease [Thermoanaerobaculia bacterium]
MERLKETRTRGTVAGLAIALFALLAMAGCSTNPATGRPQLALISEQQEIQMGLDNDQQVRQQLGIYADPKLQEYVNRVGQKLAAASERPNLAWTFRVIDDPVVNAFAIPGGHVYVTRGLMTHLTSEAELAGVLGHEIGHVTARHSVTQMSKQELAQIGLLAGAILSPAVADLSNLAAQGLQVLFLKYSRDDERQADQLGLRYMYQQGYDPREMPRVFEVLRRVSAAQGAGRIPGWLSTHPTEEERIRTISAEVARLGGDFSGRTVNRDEYVRTLDGVVFGQNPREGYFVGTTFVQPELKFQIRFPDGWKTSNERSAAGAISPNQDAAVSVSLSGQSSAQAAARQFFAQQGVQSGQEVQVSPNGLTAVSRIFGIQGSSVDYEGIASFVEHDGKVYQILGFTGTQSWQRYEDVLSGTIATFGPVRDRRALEVQPKRIAVVSLPGEMTLQDFAQRYPSTVDLQTLAILNEAEASTRFPAGATVKRVMGGELPTISAVDLPWGLPGPPGHRFATRGARR